MSRKFAAHWIFTDSYTCQIVFIDFSGGVLLVAKILEGLTKIKGTQGQLANLVEFLGAKLKTYLVLGRTAAEGL